MKRINWLMVLPLVLTAGFFALAGVRLASNSADQSAGVDTAALPSTREGRPAPPLSLDRLGETPLLTSEDLAAGGEGLVVLNFWASWCPPCRAEHPTLTALAEAGMPLYGVNYRDRIDQALGFLDELGNPYARLGRDERARNGADWGVVAMPETFFIDGDGVVVLHIRGPVTRRALDDRIRPALAEAGYDLPELPPLPGG
ncbi:DsbE family thiol:disulfide interchange protein [Rhodobacterales bacterium HKCCE2091]|nr:DsbE family thiol:disulfide interchange protein [Rhodobacterales bacterium HKCCE2091]